MALPSSGPISACMINVEAGLTSTTCAFLSGPTATPATDSMVKLYANVSPSPVGQTAPHAYSEFYGKTFAGSTNFPADMVNGFEAILGGNSNWYGYMNTSNLNISRTNTESATSLTVPNYILTSYGGSPSLTVTQDSRLNNNTITNLGWSDSNGNKMFLVLRGTSTAITTWASMTLTVDVSKVASISSVYNPGNQAFLWLTATLDGNGDPTNGYDQEPDGIFSGMTVTGPGLTGVVTVGDAFYYTVFGAWGVAINQTVTVTSGIKYVFAKTGYVSTFNRTDATLTTYNNARDGLDNTADFLLYDWDTTSGDGSPILGNAADVEVNFTS